MFVLSEIQTLAANAMKTLLFISSFLFGQVVSGQYSKDTTISKWTLDSLKSELWQKSETINRMTWAYQLKGSITKVDTVFVRQDSMVINHMTKENKILYQESINLRKVSFKKDYCKGLIIKRFFDTNERPVFNEYWDGLCYDETEKDEDVKYFDSKLRQIERVFYNKTGQIIKRLTFEYQSYGRQAVYQFTSDYDNGKQKQTITKLDKYCFWN
jgi:hypothetical protein